LVDNGPAQRQPVSGSFLMWEALMGLQPPAPSRYAQEKARPARCSRALQIGL